MRKIILLFLAFTLVIGLGGAYFYWPKIERKYKKATRSEASTAKDIERTRELLNNSKPQEALVIIKEYSDVIDNKPETWFVLNGDKLFLEGNRNDARDEI